MLTAKSEHTQKHSKTNDRWIMTSEKGGNCLLSQLLTLKVPDYGYF